MSFILKLKRNFIKHRLLICWCQTKSGFCVLEGKSLQAWHHNFGGCFCSSWCLLSLFGFLMVTTKLNTIAPITVSFYALKIQQCSNSKAKLRDPLQAKIFSTNYPNLRNNVCLMVKLSRVWEVQTDGWRIQTSPSVQPSPGTQTYRQHFKQLSWKLDFKSEFQMGCRWHLQRLFFLWRRKEGKGKCVCLASVSGWNKWVPVQTQTCLMSL